MNNSFFPVFFPKTDGIRPFSRCPGLQFSPLSDKSDMDFSVRLCYNVVIIFILPAQEEAALCPARWNVIS